MAQRHRARSDVRRRVEKSFALWLGRQSLLHGWSFPELVDLTGLPPATVNGLLSNRVPPTWELCAQISWALCLSPAQVFRRAGLLPPDGELHSTHLAEALETLAMLPEGPIARGAFEAVYAVAQHAHQRAMAAGGRDD